MFFRLPVVRFFNRVINRATVTVALVLLQIGWLLWAFFSLTAGKVWVNAGLNVLSLFITLYLVRKDENSDYKIIWLVLIGMMPLLGGALYLAFGNKAPAKRMRQRMQAVERQHTADLAQQPGQTDALDPASRGLSRYVSEYGPYPAWKNSTAKYYPCGEAMYPDLLADLEKAERFIFLEFFIVRTGKMWKGVEDILVRKAAQGVDVRLIYDDFGSLLGLPSDFVVKMERAHIRCIPFNPVVPLVSLVMNHRDHRKIVVVDGNTAYTGGINLADEYINEEERFGYWKDAALRTEGAAVWNFTVMFLDHWNAFRPSEEDYAPFMPQAVSLSAQSDGVIQPYGDSPLDEEALAETVYLNIINQAQRYVYIYTPYFAVGETMLEALKAAAKRGVDVRLIYDDFGSLLGLPSDFVVKMERAHIRCIPFNPVVPLVSLVMNHRDHRKIVVVDGNTAYTGGINLADEYINEEERFGYWKDAALRTEGAAVWNFTVMFLDHWNAFRPSEEDYAPFMPQAVSLSAQSDGVIQPYGDSPLDEEALAETVYLNIINQAQRYVYIYTPYFAVGETMLEALKAAAKRGVDVRLVLPGIPDKKLVFRLTRSYYVPLLRAGVRIYEFTPGFLHAKCYVSDDRAAVVGSINMDYRSLFLHFECGALLLYNSQVIALRDDVLRTLPECREVQLADCRTSLAGTLLDSVLRLLSPLM